MFDKTDDNTDVDKKGAYAPVFHYRSDQSGQPGAHLGAQAAPSVAGPYQRWLPVVVGVAAVASVIALGSFFMMSPARVDEAIQTQPQPPAPRLSGASEAPSTLSPQAQPSAQSPLTTPPAASQSGASSGTSPDAVPGPEALPVPTFASADEIDNDADTDVEEMQVEENPTGSTDSGAPTFDVVRVDPTGEVVVAGRAAAGADVTIMDNGDALSATQSTTTGEFVAIPDQPLTPGSHTLSLRVTPEDGGVPLESPNRVVVVVPEQPDLAPLALLLNDAAGGPSQLLQGPDVPDGLELTLSQIDYDSAGRATYQGTGRSSARVRLYLDNALIGEAPVIGGQRWLLSSDQPVAPGVHELRLDQVNAAGEVEARIVVSFEREDAAEAPVSLWQSEAGAQADTQTEFQAQRVEQIPNRSAGAAAPSGATMAGQAVGQVAAQSTSQASAQGKIAPTEKVQLVSGFIKVRQGQSLWKIARSVYGEGMQYTVIYQSNQQQIRDPDLIYPGQVFTLPRSE